MTTPPKDYYTLGDLIGKWEQGELTLDEVLARWPDDDDAAPPDPIIRELLRMLLTQARRIAALERWAMRTEGKR